MHRTNVRNLLVAGLLILGCKDPASGDTDGGSSSGGASSGGASTGVTSITAGTTVEDPTTGNTPTTGDASTGVLSTTGSATVGETLGTTEALTGSTTMDQTTGPPADCVPLLCDGMQYACGDCMDNDGDGKYDTADPECISPCDDREDSFSTGIPGDNVDPCLQDCFWDGNSGDGDDGCKWNVACDPENPNSMNCPMIPNSCPEMQSQECMDYCGSPNGCDCFGCCSVTVDGMDYNIFLGDPDCTLAEIESCDSCTPSDNCLDPCVPEACEVCFGQELPPECEDPTCDNMMPCMLDDMGGSNCPEDMFCQTGCCQPIVPG